MRYEEKCTPQWGRVLWITDENTEVAVALDFGIRIVHLSCAGCENLFYEQPNDCSDGYTEGNWRLYGGHRLWLAPEGSDSYYPDNEPVSYTVFDDGILFEQQFDPWLKVYKRLRLNISADGSVCIDQQVENASDHVVEFAAWGVNTLDGGGKAEIAFGFKDRDSLVPQRIVSLWSDTNLHDPRVRFEKDRLFAQHLPMDDFFKIGLYSNPGKAVYWNKGQRFELTFASDDLELYPDYGCNFELYMCKQFIELESLGKKTMILPGQCASHTEVWRVEKCD